MRCLPFGVVKTSRVPFYSFPSLVETDIAADRNRKAIVMASTFPPLSNLLITRNDRDLLGKGNTAFSRGPRVFCETGSISKATPPRLTCVIRRQFEQRRGRRSNHAKFVKARAYPVPLAISKVPKSTPARVFPEQVVCRWNVVGAAHRLAEFRGSFSSMRRHRYRG